MRRGIVPYFGPPPMASTYVQHMGMGAASTSTIAEEGAASTLASVAPLTGPAAPFVAAAAGIAQLLAEFGVGSGCGQACIEATNLVNQAEPALLQNLQDYENGVIDQATAQSNYNQIWQSIVTACGAISGSAGQNCISERQQGACQWKATGTPPTPYSPAVGSCWNWYNAYYTPLTYPPTNAPASTAASTAASTVSSDVTSALSSVGIPSTYAVPIAIGVGALLLFLVIKP